ncbi:MAG: hypothetical protein OHK0024_05390 [Thalassobaculales bacterium]
MASAGGSGMTLRDRFQAWRASIGPLTPTGNGIEMLLAADDPVPLLAIARQGELEALAAIVERHGEMLEIPPGGIAEIPIDLARALERVVRRLLPGPAAGALPGLAPAAGTWTELRALPADAPVHADLRRIADTLAAVRARALRPRWAWAAVSGLYGENQPKPAAEAASPPAAGKPASRIGQAVGPVIASARGLGGRLAGWFRR